MRLDGGLPGGEAEVLFDALPDGFLADLAKLGDLPLKAVGSQERVVVQVGLDPPLKPVSYQPVVASRPGLLDTGAGWATPGVSPDSATFQVPAAMAALLQSLIVLVGMPSSLETSVGGRPDFSIVKAVTLTELLRCVSSSWVSQLLSCLLATDK